MSSAVRSAFPAPPRTERRVLRVLGTEITLLEEVRRQAEQDLGITITFEMLDFLGAQHKAATQPRTFDLYDQCFHNLDIVWFWRAVQPIDTQRIRLWDETERPHEDGPRQRLCADPARRCAREQALCPARPVAGRPPLAPRQHDADRL